MTTSRVTRFFYLLLGKLRLPLLFAFALLTLLLAVPALQVDIEQDNASMAAAEPTQVARYKDFQHRFGRDDLLLLGLQDPDLLSRSGLERLDRLTRKIEALPQIDRVFSLSNARVAVPGPFGAEPASLLPAHDSADFAVQLTTRLQEHPIQAKRLLSADRQIAALLAIPTEMDGAELQRLVSTLREMNQQLPDGSRLYLTGIPVQKADVARAIQRDQRTIIPLSVAILGFLLLLLFRRPLGVLLPLAVMAISLIWTIGLYSLAGLQLNTVTALLPPVIMVLSVATSVHLLHGWLELAGEKGEVRTLLAHCMATLFVPCLLTALTTAIGLLSLSICEIPAVRYFGLFAGIGTLLAFGVAMLLIPVLLSWQPIPPRPTGRQLRPLRNALRRLAKLTLWRPGMILIATALLCALALPGLWQIRNNTDLVRFFRPSSPLHADTIALDQRLGGVESLEMVISRQDGQPLDAALLNRLADWQKQLERRPQVSGSFGLPDLLGTLWHADRPDSNRDLPESDAELLEIFDLLAGIGDRDLVGQLVSSDLRHTRLSVQLHLQGSASASRLNDLLLAEGRHQLGPNVELQATGDFLLMSGDSNRLVVSLLNSFALSLSLVLVALYATFRNWRLLLVALAPNLIPLLWTGGLMGWFNIDLNTGTAMIAAVTIGLVVDDTIHFLHRYQREQRGYIKPALIRTTLGVGPALVISTLVLTLGFWVGVFGSFLPTAWFSLLTGATLIGALVCDLLVLPAGLLVLGRLRYHALAPALILAFMLCPSPQATAAPLSEMLQQNRSDLPVRSAPIPAKPPHVGELKLLKRGEAVVLQTDLETTLLRRVLAAISSKERQRWPADSAEHAVMLDYLGQLQDAGVAAEVLVADKPAGSDRRRRLQIEFIAAPPAYHVAFFLPDNTSVRRLHSSQQISKNFCLTEIRAILAEHLQLDAAETTNILAPLLPPATLDTENP